MSTPEEQFDAIVAELRTSSHGSQHLTKLSDFVRGLKKKKRPFLAPRLLTTPLTWIDNKERGIWETEEEAMQNKYWLLQGFVVKSDHVIGLKGRAESSHWLALSADCDCVRAPLVHLAAIHPAIDSSILSLATSFKTTRYFPLPSSQKDAVWNIADLETPYFIERDKVPFVQCEAALSIDAWHILNAVLQDRFTRALNIADSEALRAG